MVTGTLGFGFRHLCDPRSLGVSPQSLTPVHFEYSGQEECVDVETNMGIRPRHSSWQKPQAARILLREKANVLNFTGHIPPSPSSLPFASLLPPSTPLPSLRCHLRHSGTLAVPHTCQGVPALGLGPWCFLSLECSSLQ